MSLKTMRETVITYHEASKTNTQIDAIDNLIFKKEKDEKTTKTIELNSSEFPTKALGLSLASISASDGGIQDRA